MTSMADDRDTLSALFDGELRDDAARFAARRLGHDMQWRQSVERWQLIGDVMRGQASTLAPAGFAERVTAAIADESELLVDVASVEAAAPEHAAPVRVASRQRARLWGGMALAASVAAVAALVMPSMRDDVRSAAPIVAAPMSVPASPPAAGPAVAANSPRVAVATPSRPPARRTRAVGTRIARAQPMRPATPVLASEPVRVATRPFQPPVEDPVTTRPWPRATLPGLQAGGALTAGYSGNAARTGDGPSFYPFEPDAQADAVAPAPSP